MKKDLLRDKVLQARLALTSETVNALSQTIQDKLLKSPYWPTRGSLGLYSSVKNEVLTHTLFQKGLEKGLHVFFPRVEQGIKFYEVNGPEDLERGSWSILEPRKHCHELSPDAKFDLLIVPGIVFTPDCYRIGYGMGFYDKFFLSLAKDVPTVSLAYDFQIAEFVKEPWDRPVRAVITEKKIYPKESAA